MFLESHQLQKINSTRPNIIVGIIIFGIGVATLRYASRMIDYNARSYPKIYTRTMRIFSLALAYIVGAAFVVSGILIALGR